jgi:hypothetical protein
MTRAPRSLHCRKNHQLRQRRGRTPRPSRAGVVILAWTAGPFPHVATSAQRWMTAR